MRPSNREAPTSPSAAGRGVVTPHLTPAQERLLRHLCSNPLGVDCSGRKWRTLLALDSKGLADAMKTGAGARPLRGWRW